MSRAGRIPDLVRFWATGGEGAALVPASGLLSRLETFASAVMAFLGVIAAVFAISAGGLAAKWDGELARSATLRMPAGAGQAQIETALEILAQTPGVVSAAPVSEQEMQALLAPFLGEAAPLAEIGAPALIAVEIDGGGPDADALARRLALELPGAVWDDHGRWRRPLLAAASGLRALSLASLVLVVGALASVVALGARASLAANRPVVETLRLMGATDPFIAAAFVRRTTIRAGIGGVLGAVAALLALLALGWVGAPTMAPDAGFGAEAGLAIIPALTGAGWATALLAPAACAATAWATTRAAARATLRSLG
ncbi:MAG: cell division transport system permease protein [Paracoccaceae bacterium]|jgi:cell division transport system permease protein